MNLEPIIKKLNISSLNQMQKSTLEAAEKHNEIILLSPTGSGKTLGFLFPVLKNLDKNATGIQALIIVPARELALQIEQVFKNMGTDFKVSVCYGGHDKKIEINNFTEAPAVLIGTPGRIAYHLKHKNFETLSIKTFVLDEFDKALQLGFTEDITYIISELKNLTQKILTSATNISEMPSFTGIITPKIINFLNSESSKPALKFKKVETLPEEKLETLFQLICKIGNKRTLIFCNHRDAVDRISALLEEKGIARETFHGGLAQDERERALLKFRNDSARVLITTDLAARGLDIPEVESIVHYQLPVAEDAFIHRNGRTARMNAHGVVYLIIAEDEHFPFLKTKIDEESLEGNFKIPEMTPFVTLYLSAGKKDKVNKVDIVGFLFKKGELQKEDVGLIEVKDSTSYAAVNRKKVNHLLKKLSNQRLKNKKLKIEIAY